MKELASLDALPPADACAVIINCGTRWYSTLALAGCRRHFDGPVLLINCGDQDGSRAHFRRLADTVDDGFHWLEWPLRKHGTALDALFARIPARRVLLVDSDLEIRGRAIVDDLFATLDAHADAYGAGFLQEATWLMPPVHKLPPHVAYYATRPWIPLVLLDVAKVRKALDAGASFLAERSHAELGGGRWARLLAHRFRLPLLRRVPQPRSRRRLSGQCPRPTPAWVYWDTGARLHAWLEGDGGCFSVAPGRDWGQVNHYNGATRARLSGALYRLAMRLGLLSRHENIEDDDDRRIVAPRLEADYPEYLMPDDRPQGKA